MILLALDLALGLLLLALVGLLVLALRFFTVAILLLKLKLYNRINKYQKWQNRRDMILHVGLVKHYYLEIKKLQEPILSIWYFVIWTVSK